MHYGSKGWYVAELKSRGSRTMKEESFKAIKPIFLPTCLNQRKNNLKYGKAAHVDMRGFFLFNRQQPVLFFIKDALQLSDSAASLKIRSMAVRFLHHGS